MMDFDRVSRAVSSLKLMKYFPSDEDACLALCSDLAEMATSEDQIEWTIRRVRNLYPEWPGIRELRAVFCSRFKPKDGITAYSTVYLDGLPPSTEGAALMIAMPDLKALPPGQTISVNIEVGSAMHVAAKTNEVLCNMGGPATKEEIQAAPAWLRQLCGYE